MAATQIEGRPLQEWANAHKPAEDLYFKDGYWDQIVFVRDRVTSLLAANHEEFESIRDRMKVISAHTSKSVYLPVFRVELADGTAFTMRYNFHDWKVSVESSRDVVADFMGLFNPDERINRVYCEGFPAELVYGPYSENKRMFTFELPPGNYYLFVFFWIYSYQALGNRKMNGSGA